MQRRKILRRLGLLPRLAIAIVVGILIGLLSRSSGNFAIVLGLGMAFLHEERLYGVLKDFQNIIVSVIKVIIIPLLPWHIAGIFANLTSAGQIFQILTTFGKLYALILSLQVAYLIVQYLLAFFYTGKNPIEAIRNMLPAYFTALGTQSSAATIPVTLQSTRKNGVSEEVTDFVIPLDATIHLAGDTIMLTVASMAVLLMGGRIPSVGLMLPFILLLGVTMVAAPGIPGGGVISALGLLEGMLGFGAAETSLMIAFHFAQDSFGTATNVTGDGAMAMIIDKLAKKRQPRATAPQPGDD